VVISIYPGSFDPITHGHLDIISRAFKLSDRLVIAVGLHNQKASFFSVDERIDMIRASLGSVLPELCPKTKIVAFDGLIIDLALQEGATILVRGLRDSTDLDYEMRMVGINSALSLDIQTVFLPASAEVRHISSSIARQVVELGGNAAAFVPTLVAEALSKKFTGRC